jgi:hypothetical protein
MPMADAIVDDPPTASTTTSAPPESEDPIRCEPVARRTAAERPSLLVTTSAPKLRANAVWWGYLAATRIVALGKIPLSDATVAKPMVPAPRTAMVGVEPEIGDEAAMCAA